MWAHITNGTIDQTATTLPPTWDDGERWWDLRPGQADPAAAGWHEVVETPRPDDTATDTSDPSVQLANGVPTRVWTVRPWTTDELTERAEAVVAAQLVTDTVADLAKIDAAITDLATLLGDDTVPGSYKALIGPTTAAAGTTSLRAILAQDNQTITSAQSIKGLIRILIDVLQADRTAAAAQRRIARQVARLGRTTTGTDTTADVGQDIS